MAAHMLDHFVFTARRLSERTKSIVFIIIAGAVVGNFWWFRGVAWGMDGPINNHWGLSWRKVRRSFFPLEMVGRRLIISVWFFSRGIFTISVEHGNLSSIVAGFARNDAKNTKTPYQTRWISLSSSLLPSVVCLFRYS